MRMLVLLFCVYQLWSEQTLFTLAVWVPFAVRAWPAISEPVYKVLLVATFIQFVLYTPAPHLCTTIPLLLPLFLV